MNEDIESIANLETSQIEDIKTALEGVNVSAERVSRTMSRAFSNAIVSGQSLEAVLKSVALSLSRMALTASLKPLQQGLSSAVGSLFSSLSGAGGSGTPSIAPFADGGIVSSPVYFGSGGGVGLMGERGAEAIIPLSRGPDGKLGLDAGGQKSRAVQVTVNISTPNVESFQRSQVQIAGALARAVGRGRRGL